MRTLIRSALAASLLLTLALGGCGYGGHSDDCGDNPLPPGPYTRVVKVDGTPFNGTSTLDIPVSRTAGEARTVKLEYTVQRTVSFCGGGWFGAWSFHYINLPAGVTATYDPATLPAAQGVQDLQTLTTTVIFAPTVPDGRLKLDLFSSDVGPALAGPSYTLVLTTAP